MALTNSDRERLAHLLAMFSSNFDGEVVNAARAAERLIKRSGETWESVIIHGIAGPTRRETYEPPRHHHKPQPRERGAADHKAEVEACQEQAHLLTAWEQEFLTSILDRWSLSEKQRARLDQIKDKLKKYEGMDW